jgi:transcriptional activator HAC1
MESWTSQTPSPSLKFENSPAESFLSTPGEMYPPLFGTSSPATTMNPLDIMTPKSYSEERSADMSVLSGLAGAAPEAESTGSSDKKQTKKRKSWGQVLPEPKTNLPPRYEGRLL